MRNTKIIALAAFLTVAAWQGTARATFSGLPWPDPPNNSLKFGDFYSYSLPYLNNLYGFQPDNPQAPFTKSSNGTDLRHDIVIATGVNSANFYNNDNSGIDFPYETPNGNDNDTTNFSFNTKYLEPSQTAPPFSPDPGSPRQAQWNATLAAIQTYLGPDNDFIVFFNLNENKRRTLDYSDIASDSSVVEPLYSNDLLIAARFSIIDASGSVLLDRYVTSPVVADPDSSGFNLLDETVPLDGSGYANPYWAHVHGQITVDENGVYKHFGPKLTTDPNNWDEIDQNLGANIAAFAIFDPVLNDWIKNADYANRGYVLGVDVKYAFANNGYEQIFIQAHPVSGEVTIPEPSVFAGLLSLGCVWFAGRAWRRRRAWS